MNIIDAVKLATSGIKITRKYWIDIVKKYPDNQHDTKIKRSENTPVYFVYNKDHEILLVYNRYKELIKQYADKYNTFTFDYSDILADDYTVYRDVLLDDALKVGDSDAT